MKHAFALLLAVLVLGACAAHNSHRIVVDLAHDFDPLIDEAYAHLMEQWPPDEPGGLIATRVRVAPLTVRWSPLVADPAAPGPIEQAAMAQRLEARLRQLTGGTPDPSYTPAYVITAELETDLHDPATITYGLSCSLASAAKPKQVLARGYSKLVRLERLYCHGCNETLADLGADLHQHEYSADDGDGDYGWGWGFWAGFYCPSSSGSGYSKVHR